MRSDGARRVRTILSGEEGVRARCPSQSARVRLARRACAVMALVLVAEKEAREVVPLVIPAACQT